MAAAIGLDLGDERVDLARGGADEARPGRPATASMVARSRPSRGSAASRSSEVVAVGAPSRWRQGDGHGVLLDGLVGLLAPDPGPHRGHQHLGGGEERQVAVAARARSRPGRRRSSSSTVEQRLEQPVGGEEGVGQRHPAHHRAAHVALVPLVAGELGDHRQVAPQDDGQPADALARTGCSSCGAWPSEPTWPGAKPSVTSSWPAMSRMVVARLAGPAAACTSADDDVEVERAGVHLADVGEDVAEAEVGEHRLLQPVDGVGVAAEQVELVLLGADRALDAPQRVAGEQVVDPVVGLRAAPRRRWRSACRGWWPGRGRCGCGRP